MKWWVLTSRTPNVLLWLLSVATLYPEVALESWPDHVPLSSTPDLPLSLTLLPKNTYPQARCLDGTQAGYYYRAAPSGSSNADKFVVFLEGGGLCAEPVDCEHRKHTHYGSSSYWSNQTVQGNVMSGNSTTNPHFYDWNIVYVAYCSGDTYLGQRTATFGTFLFSGHLILEGIVDHLQVHRRLATASHVLLAGSSAGGLGALHHANWLRTRLPSALVKVTPQAGWYLPKGAEFYYEFEVGINEPVDMTAARYFTDMFDAYVDEACLAANPSSKHVCWSAHVLYQYISTPLFVVENRFDKNQINDIMQCPGTKSEEANKFMSHYGDLMMASLQQVVASPKKDGLFVPSCNVHTDDLCVSGGPRVQGHQYGDLLHDWFTGANTLPHQVIDDCEGSLPCNPACECPSDKHKPSQSPRHGAPATEEGRLEERHAGEGPEEEPHSRGWSSLHRVLATGARRQGARQIGHGPGLPLERSTWQ